MRSQFQNVGRCIYCDSTEPPLTREHVIARGLGGNRAPNSGPEAMVLLRATCEDCREITRKFEDECLTNMLGHARARLNLNRKDRKPSHAKLNVRRHDGRARKEDLDLDYALGAMVLPSYPPAKVLVGKESEERTMEWMCVLAEEHRRQRDPTIHQISVDVKCDTVAYARMLSKIGLGLAHYVLGPDAFDPIAREFIRFGKKEECGEFVGGYSHRDGAPLAHGVLHHLGLWQHNSFLVASIQLFAQYDGAPVNYAVVGPLRREPPGLPHLHLGTPSPRPDKTLSHEMAGRPNETIRWDLSFPSSPASDEPETK